MDNRILLNVEKPARYMGGEVGTARKPATEVRVVLAFPDVYEVGMSHLGLKILHAVLNDVDWAVAERVYAPWPDMEALLRRDGLPLTALESDTPVADADILAFTLQYELSYTNILNMLDLAGLPLRAEERGAEYPLVLGGGPCAYNPEPLAEFFDAILLGDGEEAILEIAEAYRAWKRAGTAKADLLERLATIEGVYIPSFFDVRYDAEGRMAAIEPLRPGYAKVRRRFLADLEGARYPDVPVVPFLKTVHDRVSLEIARGCTRGCRFCQAGYIYRPVRERSPESILSLAEAALRNSGYDEVSLLSLSTGDYGCIAPLLKELMARFAEDRIAVSFPSLRVGTLTRDLVDEVKKVRKTGFTLAPEAGSERLRLAINKGIAEEDLLASAREVFSAGWRLIKLYFMIGLPGETDEDLFGIVDLGKKVKEQGRIAGRGGEVNVAVSTFVPKPHTPFQWEPQIDFATIRERQELLRGELKKRRVNFKWQDARLSFMEGVFARGDRRLGKVLVAAQRLGCRFDGWGEHFDWEKWQQAFVEAGIDPVFYHRRRGLDEILPWDHLECGVDKEYLRRELENSSAGHYTPDCRTGQCSGCGVCDFQELKMRLNTPDFVETHDHASLQAQTPPQLQEAPARIRLRFAKTGRMALLSHLELITLFSRSVIRAGIPIRYSQGFHPHPKFSFATALSVGVESCAEYMDMEIAAGFPAASVLSSLNQVLPEGMEILEAAEIPSRSPSLSVIIISVRYRVTLPAGMQLDLPSLAERFLDKESVIQTREKKGKTSEFDLRKELVDLKVADNSLEMVTGRGKPLEFVAAITGLAPEALAGCRIEKLGVVFTDKEDQI